MDNPDKIAIETVRRCANEILSLDPWELYGEDIQRSFALGYRIGTIQAHDILVKELRNTQ